MEKFLRIVLCTGLIYLFTTNVLSQIARETGFKYYRNYGADVYQGHPQNECILQDKRGFIYIANWDGLLEFDGVSWRKIPIPHLKVFSLAIDETGTIFVGGG